MKRKHFYEGMRPLPSDFTELQDNINNAITQVTHNVTGTGVLEGLVTTTTNNIITITAGRAVNSVGNTLTLTVDTHLPLSDGTLVLRHTLVDDDTITTIQQTTEWKNKLDTTTALIVPTPEPDDLVLAHINNNHLTPTQPLAPGWNSLRELIRAEIAAAKKQALDEAHPVGSVYIQFPGQKSPKELLLGGSDSWVAVDYDGCFFRAAGGNALAFGDGVQQDAGRNIIGTLTLLVEHYFPLSGIFYSQYRIPNALNRGTGTAYCVGVDAARSWGKSHTTGAGYDSFENNEIVNKYGPPEFRPKNQTIIIWERLA